MPKLFHRFFLRAKQIAEKFHLSKNLSDAIHEQIKAQHRQIRLNYLDIHKSEESEPKKVIEPIPKPDHISPRMQLRFDSIKRLKEKGLSDRAIAKRLGSSRNTIRRYRNNYEKFYGIINEGMQNQLTRKAIFQTIQQGGFKGKLTAFNYWFSITFPDYKSRLSIYVCNPLWGVCPKSGVLSEDHILANEIIGANMLLRTLRALATSFKRMLGQENSKMLDRWVIQANSSEIGKIKSFVRGLKMDWEAVKNAIKYKWTNGVVEGNVNRLKSKKREMYGRAGFELLRRKVCLSVNG